MKGHWVTLRRSPAPLTWVMRRILPGWAAITIGHTVWIAEGTTIDHRLLRHEMTHVAQWDEYGWTFPFRYLWENYRYGYAGNRFEIEARHA